ncbi:MAG: T9SS type A sorting domain-containing protein [Chloroherpetonaceae bacterium]
MTKLFFLPLYLSTLLFGLPIYAQVDSSAGGTFQITINAPFAHKGASMVRLSDGRLAIIGGHGTGFVSLNQIQVYQNGNFSLITLPYPADASGVARLQDGRILIFGGSSDLGVPNYSDACIFNPNTNQVVSTGNTNLFRAASGAGVLLNGRVLVAGAWWVHNNAHTQAEIYNPASGTFSLTGTLNTQRSLPLVIPTPDSGAAILGGTAPTGEPPITVVEKYNHLTGTFSVVRDHVISGSDPGWQVFSDLARPIDEMRLSDGRYILLLGKDTNQTTSYALGVFNPASLEVTRLNITPPLPNSSEAVFLQGLYDATRQNMYLLAAVPPNHRYLRLYTVHLPTLRRTDPRGSFNAIDYAYNTCLGLLPNGDLFLSGGSTDGSNFSPTSRNIIISPNLLSVSDASSPRDFTLYQNYPNPFNPTTVIRYQLPSVALVRLDVFDLLGRQVASLVNSTQAPGDYAIPFNAANLSSGVYFYRLQASATSRTSNLAFVQTKKMMLVK